jgi:ribosomal protein L37AE/L43A
MNPAGQASRSENPPVCPQCGTASQVWKNQITGLWTCHRLGCEPHREIVRPEPIEKVTSPATAEDAEIASSIAQRNQAEGAAIQVPACTIVRQGHRYDAENLQHVPQLVIEFTPVPFGIPTKSTGWADRDALADMLTALAAKPNTQPEPDSK